jgi:SPP1 gp7 family putative phage head morphogenesis protein
VQAVEASYAIGQEAISVEAAASLNVTDRQVQNFLSDNATFWIGNHYDQQVQERIRSAADEVLSTEDGTLGRRKAARKFRDKFQGEFQKSNSYWRMLANDVTTKSREFGRVEGMVKADIEEYMIDAILDRRTSDICRELDGKTFRVERAVEHRDAIVNAEEPEAIKEQSPWLAAEELEPLSNEELAERGVLTPPFHGNCRSRLQAL